MTHYRNLAEEDAATIVQLERQLHKLIKAAERHIDHSAPGHLLRDAIETAKAHLE